MNRLVVGGLHRWRSVQRRRSVDVDSTIALATDLYELTMAASYAALAMDAEATFSLFIRNLPDERSYLVAAGLEDALNRLEALSFKADAISYLRSVPALRVDVLDVLARMRFHGDVWAVPEGRIVFAGEPLVEVKAPIIEAQLVETSLINALHFPTLVASKAARCVAAGRGKPLVDFGLRRTPGVEAGLAVARACYVAGFASTSNVLAGQRFGIPVAGTVAHSFVEVFPSELEAFLAFAQTFPGEMTLLVDTYDTLRGVEHAVQVARVLAEKGRKVAAIRLDSGDLERLSREARRILDEGGARDVRIFASGGLDEYAIDRLVRAGAPIDAFGVGTRIGMSADAPTLDMAYKIVEYGGRPVLKLSEGKASLVGAKQVWRRRTGNGTFERDRIAARDEPAPGPEWEALLEPVMIEGRPVRAGTLEEARERHARDRAALPHDLLSIGARAPYPVERSDVLDGRQRAAVAEVERRERLR